MSMTYGGNGDYPNVHLSAELFVDAGLSNAVTRNTAWTGMSGNVDTATGDLTGTTGVDGHITVSAMTDGTIKIENRSGNTAAIQITFR